MSSKMTTATREKKWEKSKKRGPPVKSKQTNWKLDWPHNHTDRGLQCAIQTQTKLL